MGTLIAFFLGLLFGIRLVVSGMSNPAKVLGFLDVFGAWDPSLALVMIGAVAVAATAFAFIRSRTRTLIGADFRLPAAGSLDRRLVRGSAVFGVGWGLAGFCPGPAMVAIGMGEWTAVLFVLAMIAGMAAFEALQALDSIRRGQQPQDA